MGYKTHSLFSIVFAIAIINFLELIGINEYSYLISNNIINFDTAFFILFLMLGSLLPDLDHANSKASQNIPFVNKFLSLFKIKHRGITHSLLGTVLFVVLFHQLYIRDIITRTILLALTLGFLSHLFSDMLNPTGIPLFFPIKKKFNLLNISTGSVKEKVFLTLVVLFISYYTLETLNILKVF